MERKEAIDYKTCPGEFFFLGGVDYPKSQSFKRVAGKWKLAACIARNLTKAPDHPFMAHTLCLKQRILLPAKKRVLLRKICQNSSQ